MRSFTYVPRYTVDDYNVWEGDWELIDGVPFALYPANNRIHQVLAARLCCQLSNSIKSQQELEENYLVIHSLDWIVDNNTVIRPDISVIRTQSEDYITSPPILIIEVLSPSTALKDRQVKFNIYEEQGVKYFIVVDPNIRNYSVYLLGEGKYIQQQVVHDFVIHDGCVIQLDIEKALSEL